jgi:tripartite-type tricarboxylate transporter receptor subunit TctC
MLTGGALAAPMLAAGVARAQSDWPNKPVKYINVFPAGGPTDTLSRIVCHQLSELTGQQFIVDNKAGSGGNVGADAIAKSPPDGYTIGLYTVASHAIAPTLYAKLPFDAGKDFTAIAMLWSVPNLLMTRLDLPAKTVPELITIVRESPGKYSFASSGPGTSPQISGELFKQLAKVNLLHVPYKGSAPAHQDLLAGQVDMMWDNIPGPLALMRSGKVRGLAVTSAQRHPAVPEIPTMA